MLTRLCQCFAVARQKCWWKEPYGLECMAVRYGHLCPLAWTWGYDHGKGGKLDTGERAEMCKDARRSDLGQECPGRGGYSRDRRPVDQKDTVRSNGADAGRLESRDDVGARYLASAICSCPHLTVCKYLDCATERFVGSLVCRVGEETWRRR